MAKEHLKPSLLSTAVAAGLAVTAMPAHALSLGISGQINKQLSHVDDGDNSAFSVFDNINSGSRFRFTGEEKITEGLRVGGVWEWQWSNSPSSGAIFNAQGEFNETNAALQDRKTELYFAGKWGQVSIGKGDGAGNGSAEVDLSGTTVIDYASAGSDQFGSVTFGGTATTVTAVSQLGSFDMFSRNNRLRYDTPTIAKWLSVAVSRADGGLTEVAVWVNGTIGSTRLAAAVATGNTNDVGSLETEVTAASASLLLKNGLNFTLSQSMREIENSSIEPTYQYFKAGWKKGKHALSLSLGMGKERDAADNDPTNAVLAYVYNLAKDVELYASYRDSDPDSSVSGADNITVMTVGSRIRWK